MTWSSGWADAGIFSSACRSCHQVAGINRIWESKQHVLPSSDLLICKYLTVKGLTWRESLDTCVMDISSDPSGQTCSLRPEPASSLATINSKQMGKLLYSLIQLSKPFDFRIPRLLLDFSCLSSSLARLIGEGYQCKFWFWSSPLSNFPHLTILIASLSSFGVKTVWFFSYPFFIRRLLQRFERVSG